MPVGGFHCQLLNLVLAHPESAVDARFGGDVLHSMDPSPSLSAVSSHLRQPPKRPQTSMHSAFLDRLPELLKGAAGSPRLYLHQIDESADKGLVIEADRDFYTAAFLDQRALSEQTTGAWIPLADLREVVLADQATVAKTHFIFHIGHCGSTLISRLLEAGGGNLALREPLPLRTLSVRWQASTGRTEPPSDDTAAAAGRELAFVTRLLARTFAADEVAIVKATSFTSNLGPPLLALNPANRALLLAMSADAYLATMLGAPEYAGELQDFAPARYQTLAHEIGRPGFELSGLSPGQLAGLAWLAELIKLHVIATGPGDQALFVDFDKFLSDPMAALRDIFGFLDLALDQAGLDRLATSPVLTQYSKAPDYPFDANERRRRIAEARAVAGDEIAAGHAFISELASRHGSVAGVVAHFGYSTAD